MCKFRKGMLMMHLSFIFIIVGGICTACLSRRGMLYLYPSAWENSYMEDDGRLARLPERVKLLSFDIQRYPGSDSPKDYISTVLTADGDTLRISMNHIGRMKDFYRLYQTSYDEYGGTWLTVGRDPVGTSLVYFGFLLFTLGGLGWLFSKKSQRKATLFALAVLILSLAMCLIFMNPTKGERIPVLATWWLPVHVAFAAAGYIVLACSSLLAATSLGGGFTYGQAKASGLKAPLGWDFGLKIPQIIAPGVYLLGLGIIIGAMWANVSWGRYWGWDPKETWALVTFIVYSVPLHKRIGLQRHPKALAVYLILAALTIAMTYWGVNYLSSLPSLHSYY